MAIVGQVLATPETGWKRYDDSNTNITYVGTWIVHTSDTNWYNNTAHFTANLTDCVKFNFTGSKFRILGSTNYDLGAKINVEIDGLVLGNYSQYASGITKNVLFFEAEGLSDGQHSVRILPVTNGTLYAIGWDTIDIDETGELKPYSPIAAPTNLTAVAGDSQVTLSWIAVDGASSYNVKRSTTAGGTYTTIASNVTGTSYIDTSVTNGTTYYYVVTAVTSVGESANSNEASATPVDSGKVLLVITMSDEVEKEYELSKAELDVFISWYNNRSDGNGLPYYIFNKSFNLGPFDSRKDYIVFDKIENFEVMKFSK